LAVECLLRGRQTILEIFVHLFEPRLEARAPRLRRLDERCRAGLKGRVVAIPRIAAPEGLTHRRERLQRGRGRRELLQRGRGRRERLLRGRERTDLLLRGRGRRVVLLLLLERGRRELLRIQRRAFELRLRRAPRCLPRVLRDLRRRHDGTLRLACVRNVIDEAGDAATGLARAVQRHGRAARKRRGQPFST
jgi:hypothetical protein